MLQYIDMPRAMKHVCCEFALSSSALTAAPMGWRGQFTLTAADISITCAHHGHRAQVESSASPLFLLARVPFTVSCFDLVDFV